MHNGAATHAHVAEICMTAAIHDKPITCIQSFTHPRPALGHHQSGHYIRVIIEHGSHATECEEKLNLGDAPPPKELNGLFRHFLHKAVRGRAILERNELNQF